MLASSLFGSNLNAEVHFEKPYKFTIRQQDYLLSSEFHIQSDSYNGVVKKSAFRVCVNYDLSDKHGWQATGVKRILSLGYLAAWGAEIDVIDTRKQKIGLITGKVLTTAAARFNIYEYDDEGTCNWVGIACLDGKAQSFTVYQASNNPIYPIARLDRVFVPNAKDYWSIDVYEPSMIDDRIVRIFAAFALDTQEDFLADDIPKS